MGHHPGTGMGGGESSLQVCMPLVKRCFNRPFPNYLWPHFQSESWCSSFHMQISFHSHANKTNFHMKGWASGLALKMRPKIIRKWPIMLFIDPT